MTKRAIIIGAGPAGLTAAYELLTRTDIIPIVIEKDSQVGGLAKTINYKGNRMDIGGHRFFSKSEKIIDWWLSFLPMDEEVHSRHVHIGYQKKETDFDVKKFGRGDDIMLLRPRKSRIYYQQKLFDYPLQLNLKTVRSLGFLRMTNIFCSYLYAKIFPIKPEENLEQFFKNRFGNKLYETFFKDYTEKVWGISCDQIPANWGKQRVKNLNISVLLRHAFTSLYKKNQSINQEGTSISLIEQFLYPKYGPGQMWETVAAEIKKLGGEIRLNEEFDSFVFDGKGKINSVNIKNLISSDNYSIAGDYFFSTVPVKELIPSLRDIKIDDKIKQIASKLEYRDFLIVGILVSRLIVKEENSNRKKIEDNWIYIQDKNVKAGRLQIFNNWSPFMVSDPLKTWIGVEYFCTESDEFWQLPDEKIIAQSVYEMDKIGILDEKDIEDALVVKVKKAYPSYYGSYKDFEAVKEFLNGIENLFPIGRNGMHRYNNSDHSMLTAMAAVDNIIAGKTSKENIWDINTEDEYHEEKKPD